MTTATVDQKASKSAGKLITSGLIAGLAGGLIFGMMMAMMGMLPMVSMLIGVENAIDGFIIHMAISAFIGAVYGLVIGRFPVNATTALIGGIVNGVIWWVLGALILMPLFLGMSQMVFLIGPDQWLSLMGHAIYGLVTAFVFIPLVKRS
ncbi:MAG: hypothetical protein GWN61_15105 [candidate division Zixibacteria bacterium]|nr:DUF1440 domain-containing protein [candidate division Zixibacteria bacterium]NIS47255.1 DUF1440 domain-containing protein [candidate division Zixibacteria bacterium]NIU15392.1 DUF1440 domain-containing protein [candidate division Zixibacteria bacterium]NIV07461.1 hypothetical protein [candidate division Zixibacteria bacterium]NIW46649.1 hypothetical protein [Gammaproteobacteria bacterium]